MQIIVTGAGGFVGRNLTACLLEHGDTVTAVDLAGSALDSLQRDRLEIIGLRQEDTPDRLCSLLAGRTFDAMVHLAWVGAGGPLRADYRIQLENVRTALDYYTAADRLGCKKFVAVGTIGEYMAQLAEKNKIHSENFVYANCKSMTHNLLNIIAYRKGCKAVWATLGGLYGVGDSTNNLVNYTLKTLRSGQRPTFGPAEQPFDFVNIKDCVNALRLLAVTNTVSSEFYVGSGRPRPLKEYLIEIADYAGSGIGIGINERPDDGTRYLYEWFDITALVDETGYQPAYTFEKGIKEIIGRLTEEE